jgi:4-hydroxybenzoate polyprenyltransferase
MSAVAASRSVRQQYAGVLRNLWSTRGVEVCALQASPLLGAFLAGLGVRGDNLARAGLLLLGSTALTAHVFLFNDWADYSRDKRDLRRASLSVNGSLSRNQIAWMAIVLLILASVAFAELGTSAVLLGAGIAALSLLYSFSPHLGKRTPIAASLAHLVGGALHFLLGYSVARTVDARGVVLSLVFGLVFAAGHLNQEVRDYEFDLANGIRTVAVTQGPRRGFLASFCLFTTAYLLIVGLAALGLLPKILLASVVVWLLQARWSLQALRRGLRSETALWIQLRYRLLFAVVGLAMLVR